MKTSHYNKLMRPLTCRGIISAACLAVDHGGNADVAMAVATGLLAKQYDGIAYDIAFVLLTEQVALSVELRRLTARACARRGCGRARAPGAQGCAEHAAGLVRSTCTDVEAVQ